MNLRAIRQIILRLVVMVGGEAMQSAFHLGLKRSGALKNPAVH